MPQRRISQSRVLVPQRPRDGQATPSSVHMRLAVPRSRHAPPGVESGRRAGQYGAMRLRGTAAGLIAALLLVSACSGPATPSAAPTASAPTTRPAAATATPAPSPTTPATPPGPTGPPPPAGTLDRYIYDLPRFGPAPFPLVVSPPPATGPAQQLNQIPVGDQRVAFITIDDGWTKDPDILK